MPKTPGKDTKNPKKGNPLPPSPKKRDRHLRGPLKEPMDESLKAASVSVGFDRKLAVSDVTGSLAHALMLWKVGLLSEEEFNSIRKGLEDIRRELTEDPSSFPWDESLEDVHMNIEKELIKRIGKAGEKLHAARSRNDQVALDEILFMRERALLILDELTTLRMALVKRARDAGCAPMPGYTHLQRAQPVLLAHHMMAYYQMFTRDSERLESLYHSLRFNPLGSGALSGTSLPIDPYRTADTLGFTKAALNSMDAVAGRDRLAEFLFYGAMLGINLSRAAEELVLWSSSEFGFVSLPDSLSTTSSMMPHKKNPDGAELVRGKSGRLIGNLVSLLTTLKGLPLTYNRDLQEDKEPLFDTAETLSLSVRLMAAMIEKVSFNLERLKAAADDPYVGATDLAESLVTRGVPFREAHGQVGELVAYAIGAGKALKDLSPEELRKLCPKADPKILTKLDAQSLINSKNTTPGGTAPERVAERIEEAEKDLEKLRKKLASLRDGMGLDYNKIPGESSEDLAYPGYPSDEAYD